MSSPEPQEEQTLQFYKIQIMEKDREIADFTAKMKKVEFKHNRQLKELKIAKERFESLLKDEKAKADKFSKLAQENIQQNQILELRLHELKREKQKELTDIQSKYNTLKEEVRSYERILPTFTFLCEIGQTINELPNYEDLFVNLREKVAEYSELQAIYKQAEEKWEEAFKSLRANEQTLKSKKHEAEKNSKEILAKLLENQHQLSELKLQNDDLVSTTIQLEEQLELTRQRCESLEDSIKDYESKIEKLAEQFENELINKEEQVIRTHQGELVQLEDELRNQEALLQRKESMFNQQMRLMQEENVFLTNKYQAEIETFEQHYLCIKQETERMRLQIVNEKRRYDELKERFNDSANNLIKISIIYEQTQEKNRSLEQKIGIYEHQMVKQSKKNEESDRNRYNELQRDYEQLLQKMNEVSQQFTNLESQRDQLQEENFILRQEISSKQFEHSDSKSFLTDLSKNMINFDNKSRKKSADVEVTVVVQKFQEHSFNFTKERKSSIYDQAGKIKDLQNEIALIEKRSELQSLRHQEIENRSRILENQNQRLRSEDQSLRKEKQKIMNEIIALKEKIMYLTKTNNDHEKTVYGNSTKNNMQKTKIESMEDELKLIGEDNKRQKETIKKFKEEIKSMKQSHVFEIDKLGKENKDLAVQHQSIKSERDKLKQQLTSKEKIWNHESALLKNSKELEERLKQQFKQLKKQKEDIEAINKQLLSKQSKLDEQLALLRKEIERLQLALKQSLRENELANESLERQRKERSLLTVPSLQSINGEESQEDNFNQIYSKISQKQGEINLLQREILDLKEQIETAKLTYNAKLEAMEAQNNDYVQTIIEMKMRCAQSEMRASQKEYLYVQLKKKAIAMNIILK